MFKYFNREANEESEHLGCDGKDCDCLCSTCVEARRLIEFSWDRMILEFLYSARETKEWLHE